MNSLGTISGTPIQSVTNQTLTLRAMNVVSTVQENAEDIYAEAQQINEDRAAAETEEFEDVEEVSEETTDVEEDTAE